MHTRDSSAPLMEVNCMVLDSLVLECLSKLELVEDAAAQGDENQLNARIVAFAAYQQLHQGNVCNAMAIVSKYCPSILQDQRLTFKLKRQQFIELLRQSNPAGDAAALACARDELAPLALDAYPEAYLDFKRALLMLVQQPTQLQQLQPGRELQQLTQQQQQLEDWSLGARHKLAEVLHHTLLQHLGWRSPQLSQLLVYLAHLFSEYSSSSHGSSRGASVQVQQLLQAPGADLAKSVLLEGRDESPLPPDISGMRIGERDVQALTGAVGISRAAAVDALKAAGGDAAAALAAQLMRFRLNTKHVDALVWDYAASRGLVEPDDHPGQPPAVAAATDGPAGAAAAPPPADMDIDSAPTAAAAFKAAAGLTAPSSTSSGSKAQKRSNGSSNSSSALTDDEPKVAVPSPSPFTAASTGGHTLPPCPAGAAGGPVAAAMLRSESQSPPYKVPRWRCRQTPSRFCGQEPGTATAAGTAAAGARGAENAEVKQQVQVVIDNSSCAAACGAASSALKQRQPQQATAELQQQHQDGLGKGRSSNDALAEQLVRAARVEQQQLRWQQLQQSLKSQAAAGSSSSSTSRQQEVQAALLQLQGLATKGQWEEVEALVEELQPGLLNEHPAIKFNLKHCQFTQLVQANQLPAALQLARSQLTPLADAHPELLPALKASMALLLPGPLSLLSPAGAAGDSQQAAGGSRGSEDYSSKLLSQLLPLLQSKLGVEPPPLVKLLRVLLTGHKAWFRVQRCQDPFAAALGLSKLLQVDSPAAAGEAPAAAADGAATGATTTATRGGRAGDSPVDGAAAGSGGVALGGLSGGLIDAEMLDTEDGEGLDFDEAEVLQVMEVLELPRATALELLAEHGGDAQSVILQVFGA